MDYTLAVNNKEIWEFYNKYENLNFEEINILLMRLLEQLFEASNPSLNINIATRLMENMEEMQTKLSSFGEMFSKSQEDINNNLKIKLLEFKKDYIEDMKIILCNNSNYTTDKIVPIIKEYNENILNKTCIMII